MADLTKDKYLSHAEREALIKHLTPKLKEGSRNALLFMLLLKTGARASEILLVEKKHINTKEKSILIPGLKKSRSRAIYIKPRLMQALKKYIDSLTTERLFPISYVTLQKLWYEYRPCKKPLHSLRHTYAMEVLKKTENIKTVQTGLGHRSINSTMVYADHYSADEALKKAVL